LTLLRLFRVLLLTACIFLTMPPMSGQSVQRPKIRDVQIPFASLQPSETFRIGRTADWVLVTGDAVWVAGTKPYSVQRINPRTDRIVANLLLSEEACSGLEFGFESIWVPLCGEHPALIRINAQTNIITATLPIAPAGAEGGITASSDSV
jgi:virginiamycin B lyase